MDVNSAYLSWEAVRRIRAGEEDIRLIPSAIGGDREKRTGIILAKSVPAKKFGVRTGEPVAMALAKCPGLKLFKPDFGLYIKNSREFSDICRRFAPVVEKFSIDECFLDMTGTEKIYSDPIETAEAIKEAVKNELGFTVNVGIGENKFLAKTASDFLKPDKVHTLFKEELPRKLWPLPVGEMFSVGHATAQRLIAAGIKTVGDLAAADLKSVQKSVGEKLGKQIHDYANGIDGSPVLAEPKDAKCYSISVTLEKDVTDEENAERILLALADSVAARMRSDGAETYCVGVTVRDSNFRNRSHQKKLADPTDVTDEIISASKKLFGELWDKKTPLRLIGITLSDIVHGGAVQTSMFSLGIEKRRARQRDGAIDCIRGKFGHDAIKRATLLETEISVGKKYRAQTENKEK